MTETFRADRSYCIWFPVGVVFFIAIGLGAVIAIHADPPKQNVHAFLAMALSVFGGMALLSFLGAIWAWRHRLSIEHGVISLRGLRHREIALSGIHSAKWRIYPAGGSLVLKGDDRRLVIEFSTYQSDQKLGLIRYFRSALRPSIQTGWELFCQKIALPMTKRNSPPGPDEVILKRRRIDLWCLPAIGLLSIVAYVVWQTTEEMRHLFAPALIVVLWLSLRYAVPPVGIKDKRVSAVPGVIPALLLVPIFLLGLVFIPLLLFQVSHRIPYPKEIISIAVIAWCLVWIVFLIWDVTVRARRVRQAAPQAAAEWERLPTS